MHTLNKQRPLRVLSPDDFRHWQRYGYVVVKQAVPPEQVQRCVDFLWEFQQMRRDDPASWAQAERRRHDMAELNGAGMVECYQNQTLWDNRQCPRVYDAFVDIWDEEALWVSIDRANLNPPNRGQRAFHGFMHWDADTSLPLLPVNVQGVLALSDTREDSGGFQCIPGLFEHFDAWRAAAPAGRNPWRPDLDTPGAVPWPVQFIAMQAGDLLIFNSLLAHGIRANTSADGVRLAQYISFTPADEDNSALRTERVRSWYLREPTRGYAFPGDPRGWEQTRYPRARLTALGEKILGLRDWQDARLAFAPGPDGLTATGENRRRRLS